MPHFILALRVSFSACVQASTVDINNEQAEVVKLIFDLYLGGKSVLGIVKELKERSIKSPTGKDNWPKRSIEEMLSNEKYIGVSVVNVGGKEGQIYKLNNSHPAIISKEDVTDRLDWIAFKNQFFSSVLIADQDFDKASLTSTPQQE